jgi:hypothetical protein
MTGMIQKYMFGASVVLGLGAIAATPASAGSLGNVTVSGDHLTYGADSDSTFLVDNNQSNWEAALSSKGNIELGGQGSSPDVADFSNPTTLTGNIGGQDITFSSLTADDWDNIGTQWMSDVLSANGFGFLDTNSVYQSFVSNEGQQRFSDPNIASVTQNDEGYINVDLAGHDPSIAGETIRQMVQMVGKNVNVGDIHMSEIVKYSYGGNTGYLYGVGEDSYRDSGVINEEDEKSHQAFYSAGLQGTVVDDSSAQVPEPSAILGLTALSGLLAFSRRKSQQS